MSFDLDQLQRFMSLLKRKDDLWRSVAEHAATRDKANMFGLYDAEMENVDREIDTLLREMLGEDAYQEHQRRMRSTEE